MAKFYGEDLYQADNLAEMERESNGIDIMMKNNKDWTEMGIGLYVDKTNLFLLDCNALICLVYKRDSTEEKWYCGPDTLGVACINTVDGLKEFISDYNSGLFMTEQV